jgi:hypothetical protein
VGGFVFGFLGIATGEFLDYIIMATIGAVILLFCYFVILLFCYFVILLFCYFVILLFWLRINPNPKKHDEDMLKIQTIQCVVDAKAAEIDTSAYNHS